MAVSVCHNDSDFSGWRSCSLADDPAEGLDPQNLKDYANEEMPEEVAAVLNDIVDSMIRADVRAVLWHINDVADQMRFVPFQHEGFRDGLSWAVNCAEDIGLVDPSIVHEVIAAATYPQLGPQDPDEEYSVYVIGCTFYPKTTVSPDFTNGVVTNIPVLMLQGAMDAQTPPYQAHEVESYLQDVKYVEFDSEGHVVAGKTGQCPGIIAAQFLDDKAADLDTSCAEDFGIDFVLPEGSQ